MRNISGWQTPVALSVSLALAVTTFPLASTATSTATPQNTQNSAPETISSENEDEYQLAQTSTNCRQVNTASNNLYLNIRSSPNGPVIGRVNNGEQVTIKNTGSGAWVSISAPKEGFVFGKYLKACTQTAPSPQRSRSSTTPPPADKCREVNTQSQNLNVRSSPNGPTIDSLANGTKVTIVNTGTDGWVPISAPRQGYVFGQFLKPCSQTTTPKPPTTPTTSKCRQIQSTGGIPVRQSASGNATVVGTLNNGTQVTLVNRGANGWVPISAPVNGFIPSAFLILCPN
ncbi:MAG: SH3 domain-containing protein [Symploca sp. SIO2C1]|nr:SH3 domain-containing protein [Symploca sp. SIO2C1]